MACPIIFINIGWMKKYLGPSEDDPLIADNFAYFKHYKNKKAVGHEQWNFLGKDNRVIGYVPRSSNINIRRLGAKPGQDKIEGVLVVFISRDPVVQKLKVVGWYKDAIVTRTAGFKRRFGRTTIEAPISAKHSNAYLLPVAKRTITVPTAKKSPGGVGQSPVWYAERHPALVKQVRDLVDGREPSTKNQIPPKKPPRNRDPKNRSAVEKFAMDWAMRYFDDAVDVSLQCKGWDIEARSNSETIYIEVKGISAPHVNFELTPNEYNKMREHREKYFLFVVTGALSRKAKARIFRYQGFEQCDVWMSEEGEELVFTERTGAWVKC